MEAIYTVYGKGKGSFFQSNTYKQQQLSNCPVFSALEDDYSIIGEFPRCVLCSITAEQSLELTDHYVFIKCGFPWERVVSCTYYLYFF